MKSLDKVVEISEQFSIFRKRINTNLSDRVELDI